MNIRQNLFGQGPKAGREQSGYGRPPPTPPSYAREDTPMMAGYDAGGRPPVGRTSVNGAPRPHLSSSRYPASPTSPSRKLQLNIAKVEDKTLANQYIFSNRCAVSAQDFPEYTDESDFYLLLNKKFVLTARVAKYFPPGCISLSDPQRTWLSVGLMDTISAEIYQATGNVLLAHLELDVSFASLKKTTEEPIDQDELERYYKGQFSNQFMTIGQKIVMDYKNILLMFIVRGCAVFPTDASNADASTTVDKGFFNEKTPITFYKDAKSTIKLKGSPKRPSTSSIVGPNFKFEDMGIGGLDNEFSQLFRRAFASRVFPQYLIEDLGIQHVKGILLYGPPGTGKTLIARQIGTMLNAREPKIINGPEVLNKYVGQSEENIRKLFADAEKEKKEKGNESGLHIIIFDELDAVCKQRGSGAGGGTGVGDSVVNQLLSKLDGVEQLNNILLIGMTNRKDMIDEALLRPGRLEVHLEISLPDEHGRQQILKIHLAQMTKNNALADDVNIAELAHLTKNFSGAEIAGLVKSATSWALNRHIKVGTIATINPDLGDVVVQHDDFMNALKEVKPAFGMSEDALNAALRNGIYHFSLHIGLILRDGQFQTQLVKSPKTSFASILLHGPAGSGKTALAAKIAELSEFPFVKFISPHDMIGFGEQEKVQHIRKAFSDAYKSPQSVVIIDDIERIIEWVAIGPRFSNNILQALMNYVSEQPPSAHGKSLLVIATTSQSSALRQLDLFQLFNKTIAVPNVNTHQELDAVLREANAFGNASDRTEALNALMEMTGHEQVGVGVKQVLLAVELAKMDQGNVMGQFAELIMAQMQRAMD